VIEQVVSHQSRSIIIAQTAHCADNSEEEDNLFPAKISKKGKYGYEVEWADCGSRRKAN